jgi:hypothetical protein
MTTDERSSRLTTSTDLGMEEACFLVLCITFMVYMLSSLACDCVLMYYVDRLGHGRWRWELEAG